MRNYRRTHSTQADINAYVAGIAAQLEGLNLTVTPNGYGHRIQCDTCGWSRCHGDVYGAQSHAASH